MKKRSNIIRNLLSVPFACLVCTSGAYVAVDKPQLDIQGGAVSSDGTTRTISALVIASLNGSSTIPVIPNEAFSLSATLASGAGSLDVGAGGSLLSATFSNFTLVDLGAFDLAYSPQT